MLINMDRLLISIKCESSLFIEVNELTEKRVENLAKRESDERKVEAPSDRPDILNVTDRPNTLNVTDRPDILHVTDRPDILHVSDRPNVLDSEKGPDLKKVRKGRCEPNNLQEERGGLKVKDSDFKTE